MDNEIAAIYSKLDSFTSLNKEPTDLLLLGYLFAKLKGEYSANKVAMIIMRFRLLVNQGVLDDAQYKQMIGLIAEGQYKEVTD